MRKKKKLTLKFRKKPQHFKFTTQGKRFSWLVVAILIAALNTGNNLLYLILSFMLCTILFSWLVKFFYNEKIHISIHTPEDIYAGMQFLMVIKIKNNKKWLPTNPQLLQLSDSMELASPPFIPQLKPGALTQCKIYHYFKRRGIYKLRNLMGKSTYPLGIFQYSYLLPIEEKEIVVYPKIKQIKDFFLNGSLGHEALESFIAGGSFSLYNIRDYIPGDEARFLHWKASAKLSKLMVKEFLQEEQKKVSLMLDCGLSSNLEEYKRGNFEDSVSLAASLLFYFISHDYSVRLVTSHKVIPFGWGNYHLHKMLKHLAIVEADYNDKPDLVESKLKEAELPHTLNILISYRREKLQFFSGKCIWHISNIEAVA